MQKGKKTLDNYKEKEVRAILQKIVDSCIEYAGDSYEDFGRDSLDILKRNKLVDYGYAKEDTYTKEEINCNEDYEWSD